MRQEKGNPRKERLLVLYSKEEFEQLKKHFVRSTSNTLGNYVRDVSLHAPVQVVHRNSSFDGFVEEIILLRKQLNSIQEMHLTPETERQIIRLYEDIRTKIYQIGDICMA